MKWYVFLGIFILIGYAQLPGIFAATNASVGYEENTVFVDHKNISIIEKVSNNLGQPCTDCEVWLTLLYPNRSLAVVTNMNMTLLNTTGHYNATLPNATPLWATTGFYPIMINASRNTDSGLFNGTSDRNFIEIVDVYPVSQSMWEIGLIGILTTIAFVFIYISNRHEALLYKQIFFSMGVLMPVIILMAVYNILIENISPTSGPVTMVIRLMVAYLFVFLLILGIFVINMWKDLISYIQGVKLKIK